MPVRPQNISTIYSFSICLALLLLCTGCAQKHERISIKPGECYTGYSAGFQKIKHDLYQRNDTNVVQRLDERDVKLKAKHQYDDGLAQDIGILNLLESSTLYLYAGDVDRSLEYTQLANCLIEQRDNSSIVSDWARRGWSVVGSLVGADGYSAYDPIGYEKVLLLNLEAMNFLLKGDNRAYNVARKSTEWQEAEHEKFEKHLETIESSEPDKNASQNAIEIKNKVFSRLAKEFSKYNKKALTVPSAFVNPFGDYLAGVVKEFKSVELKGERSNAKIHYEKALKLNPKSSVFRLAAKDMKNRRSASRLVQIVAFDGLAPEKKVLFFDIHLKKSKIPIHIEFPLYDPVKSKVHKIVASTTNGKTLATFRPVADIDALALRQQKELLPALQALTAIGAVRDIGLNTVKGSLVHSIDKQFQQGGDLKDAFSGLIKGVFEGIDGQLEPDTSSWMSLPSNITAARFHPAKHIKKIRITSYDVKGKQLNQQTVTLGKGGRHFIFVRTLDKKMKVIPGKKIWSSKERENDPSCWRAL